MNSRLRRLLGTVSVFALMTGCAVQPPQNGANAARSPYALRTGAGAPLGYGEAAVNLPAAGQTQKFADAKPIDENIPDVSGFKQTGRASWYGKHFNGRRTASGERFDMHAMTAAHKTLPLAAYVRVTNTTNNKSVVVKINDRGPYVRGRVIDLSFAAAREIGLQSAGTARVKIEGLTQEEALAQRQEVVASANAQQQ
ncbi:septal ring lytic transglycosylase RlpA family protein [Trinickia caryophylli]|nr:septal ring lytic transglycosylase RlpA family protein [Trinickia caryophylli]PMS13348.1 septal ring lytic transglycosylase RlpA family protein [Trinickia caryophylli]TRX19245.1 septal ring lytic transglycosylase RlpA family protein [Trinickia caryophylli]WQE13455.1 septal ring lytic transglycosylase RlpA family protein [Trinickia caryophylli]